MNILSNNILDIIISLTLIYGLLSILVSILLEWWNHYSKARGIQLKKAIFQLLNDQSINLHYGELFYNHFLIGGLKNETTRRPPQYVSSKLFADVLIDIIAQQVVHDVPIKLIASNTLQGKNYEASTVPEATVQERFLLALKKMNASPLRDVLHSFHDKSGGDYEKFKKLIEEWYNDYMDRVSGWYKTSLRKTLTVFGFIVAIGLNVDSLHLLKVISMDKSLRDNLVSTSEAFADQQVEGGERDYQDASSLLRDLNRSLPEKAQEEVRENPQSIIKYFEQKKDSLRFHQALEYIRKDSISRIHFQKADSVMGIVKALNLPIGWADNVAPLSWFSDKGECEGSIETLKSYTHHRNHCPSFWIILKYLIGVVISGVSLSFGAPFWFDLLIKFVNLRRAGKKPEPDIKK